MSTVIAIIVLVLLVMTLYAIFKRYISAALTCAVIGTIIGGALMDGKWVEGALWGAVIGLVLGFVLYYSEAWRTFLGLFIGGLIGFALCIIFQDEMSMWSYDLILLLSIVGGVSCSKLAMYDAFEGEVSSEDFEPEEEEAEEKK